MRWFSQRYFKRRLYVGMAVLLISISLICGSVLSSENKWEYRSGNIVVGADNIDAGMSQDLFHQQTLAQASDRAIAVSFDDSQCYGGVLSISPSISQTSSDTTVATSTGFMEANYLFSPSDNFGAVPVGIGMLGLPSPVTRARFSTQALFYPEMVVQGNLRKGNDAGKSDNYPVTLPPYQAGGVSGLIQALANNESELDAIGFDAKDEGLPVILSTDTIDYNASSAQINNTSIVERLWRNTHQGSILNYAYEGDTAMPTWIAPMKNPSLLIDCGEPFDTIRCALELTKPGKRLARAFWSI